MSLISLARNGGKRAFASALILVSAACGASPPKTSALDFTSSRHLKVRGELLSSLIFAERPTPTPSSTALVEQALQEIDFQLKFAIGQNRFKDSSFRHRPVVIDNIIPLGGGLQRVNYHTMVTATIPRNAPSRQLTVVLPLRTDEPTMRRIAESNPGCYQKTRAELVAEYGEASWHAMAFYFFQPERPTCQLGRDAQRNDLITDRVRLEVTRDNDDAKTPNYRAMWSDHHLKAALIFSNAKGMTDDDEGVQAYRSMYQWVLATYGSGIVQDSLAQSGADIGHPTAKIELDLHDGRTAELQLLLFPLDWRHDPAGANQENPHKTLVEEAMRNADFVSYNGHSDYGENVAKLETWSTVVPGSFQIFYINSCSSYSYLTDQLFQKHADANPGAPRSLFLDVIVNNNAGYFMYDALQNQVLLTAFMQQRLSYVDVFAQIDRLVPIANNPGMLVVGDENY